MPFNKPLLLVAVGPIGRYDRPDEDRVLLGEHVASMLWSNAGLIAALLATQLVITLYGAGVRRPFGSLPRIPDVPYSLWYAQRLVTLADVIFATFVLVMVVTLFLRMNAFVFIVLSLLFFAFGERLSHRIRLVPSFFVSIGLAALAVTLILSTESVATSMAGIMQTTACEPTPSSRPKFEIQDRSSIEVH